jgi:hypothetical protein
MPVRVVLLQRKCACGGTPGPDGECTCHRKRLSLQRRFTDQIEPATVPPIVHDVLDSLGQPLDPATRAFMEPRLGHDFGRVRVHAAASEVLRSQLTVSGPKRARGDAFTTSTLRHSQTAVSSAASPAEGAAHVGSEADEGGAGRAVTRVLSRCGPGYALPATIQRTLARLSGDDLADVRIHDDGCAHIAAGLLGARAFTISRSIYFAPGEYRPSTLDGTRLLAHEVAHAVQQREATIPALQDLRVSAPSDTRETEADRFAGAATGPDAGLRLMTPTRFARAARIQRVISFSRRNDKFTTNPMDKEEEPEGFYLRAKSEPVFEWAADVTIAGDPGDRCDSYEVGPHQVATGRWLNIYWGTGTECTRRRGYINKDLPMRDALSPSYTWYADPLARMFVKCGDTQRTSVRDAPESGYHPWQSPIPGRGGHSGRFQYGHTFVSYISARDTTAGTGAAAFQHLGHVYWGFNVLGVFDPALPLNKRVEILYSRTWHSGVYPGGSSKYQSMHGGSILNDNIRREDTEC